MKKLIALAIVLILCASMVGTVFAARGFVPSIGYKGEPVIVPVTPVRPNPPGQDPDDGPGHGPGHDPDDGPGHGPGQDPDDGPGEDPSEGPGEEETTPPVEEKPIVGIIYDKNDEEQVTEVEMDCLVITTIVNVDNNTQIPEDTAEELVQVYEELLEGTMELPYEESDDYKAEDMVIQELFDASFVCSHEENGHDHNHSETMEQEDTVFEITFQLNVEPDEPVVVMVYSEGRWQSVAHTKNNGDGTVTCTFDKMGIVAVSVEEKEETPVDPTVPTEPDVPTVPGTPTEPDVPTVPGTPTEPGAPTDPDVPTVPGTPTEPTDPGEDVKPTEATEPTEDDGPAGGDGPSQTGDDANLLLWVFLLVAAMVVFLILLVFYRREMSKQK